MKGEIVMTMTTRKTPKPLTELTLLDRFLFNEVMERPENLRVLLEIILGKEILLKYLPESEKETRTSPLNRFIKLDVWATDEDDAIYDTEVQQKNTYNLPKRSRYYQGVIDSRLLKPGTADFNELNDLFIIIIAPFDLFQKDFYLYTFRMQCEESPGLHLDDGVTRIFLNTHGINREDVSPDLIELLYLIEHTNDSGKTYQNTKLQKMSERVREIQGNSEVSVRYMQAWEERVIEQQAAKEEGRKEGRQEGIKEGFREAHLTLVRKKLTRGFDAEQIAEALELDRTEVDALIEEIQLDEKRQENER